MDREEKSISSILASVGAALLYPIFLVVSTLFVVPFSIAQQMLAGRSEVPATRRQRITHRLRWFLVIDLIATVVTYIATDYVRCTIREGRPWPEELPGFGSTAWIHAVMLGLLVFVWPSILYWLGWYRPRNRSLRWRLQNTVAAAALLAFFMSTVALLGFRVAYPRMQIGLVVVFLPIVTALLRIIIQLVERSRSSGPDGRKGLKPVW